MLSESFNRFTSVNTEINTQQAMKNRFNFFQKPVDINTQVRRMRISLKARPAAIKLNECDLTFLLLHVSRRFSLTISYHAICVGTHIDVDFTSYLGSKNSKMLNVTQRSIV